MAKKKKKQSIKVNNKIKELMNGAPFDEGIKRLNENILTELVILLNLNVPKYTKSAMIKVLRQTWAEGDISLRLKIVNLLEQLGIKSPGKKQIEEKENHIILLLNGIEHTEEEEEEIISSFINSRLSKITVEKIVNKLNYIRQNKIMKKWESVLDVKFNTNSEMEFYHPYRFEIDDDNTFTKILLTFSDYIDNKILVGEDDQYIKTKLEEFKREAIDRKELEIENFLAMKLDKGHRYLSRYQIDYLVRNMPPEDNLCEIDIPINIMKSIVANLDSSYEVTIEGENLYISKEKEYSLYDVQLPYRVVASYAKKYICNLIWSEEKLPFKLDMHHIKSKTKASFDFVIERLEDELRDIGAGLEIEKSIIRRHILNFVEPHILSSRSLKITEKIKRSIYYHFSEYIRPLKEKKKKEELLAKTIRDFKSLFPIARILKRKIIFHVGPTNSGKTYHALEHLRKAETGYYLAPLRLLALEGYEVLKSKGVAVSLITGEEEIIDEDSTHISSTIEMMNSSVDVDVAVIDEIQMIDDRDRGWAWANALIGVPAKTVILTGSIDALDAIKELCRYLDEPLEIVHFKRKNELKVLKYPTPIKSIDKGTAIVAFSRQEVLSIRQKLSQRYDVSVVYGNLSPEVRREEARRFREGESDILVATDAIAMGLNLPIKTIIFAKDNKFDGLKRRELYPSEVSQICGRAGRYGFEEVGYIGALDKKVLETIHSKLYTPLPPIRLPFSVMASLEHVMLIGDILETDNLSIILNFFADNMEFEGPFVAANIDSMLEIASIVSEYKLDLKTKYYLACSPASISSPHIESVFHRYIRLLEDNRKVEYIPPRDLPKVAHTNNMMLNAEDRVREISLYLWLSFKFPELFTDTEKAIRARVKLNNYIETSLKQGNFVKQCNRCGKHLNFNYRFSICDECFTRGKRGNRDSYRKGNSNHRRR